MTQNSFIKARPARMVADFICSDKPQLVISFGRKLPEDAAFFVQPNLAAFGIGHARPYYIVLSSNAELGGTVDMQNHPYIRAITADAGMEAILDKAASVLVHCEYGQERSPRLVLALMAGRILRVEPDLPVMSVLETVKATAFDKHGWWHNEIGLFDPSKLERDCELFLTRPLSHYREQQLALLKPSRSEPVSAKVGSATQPR